ncbi:cupin domain-containing protein [Paractinoplanes globisporus]|uniref:Cupin domain-containing protein n=1 Tax=Paractinoplanes globisporus TaxID=113565 RepID=A0ABW6WV32_9ACTN|nr:cupin domain-containing protein [Actinoplanes globisporus]
MSHPELPSIQRPTAYETWLADEGLRVVEGLYIEDLRTVELGDWARRGCKAAVARLEGAEDVNDAHIIELAPASSTEPERHLYEELVYVVSGRGTTELWNGSDDRTSFEWHAGSLFSVPLNTFSRHHNTSGTEAARFYSVTSAPLVMRLFHNRDFIYDCDFDFTDRFGPQSSFAGDGTAYQRRVWETNFIPDVAGMELKAWEARGAGSTNIMLELADSSMCGHISQFPVGTYKKAHRHTAGAHVIVVDGVGFSLLWAEGDPMQQVHWKAGSIVVPPERWFHQHFNTGTTPARYLALRWGSKKYPVFRNFQIDKPTTQGGDQIEYEDEDPAVRKMFEEELARHGAKSQMVYG